MYSSEDLERFYFKYQTEGLSKGISIQKFCLDNKVPYNIFSKWYKDTRKQVVNVQVDGHPSDAYTTSKPSQTTPVDHPPLNSSNRIMVEIRMSNGLHVSQRNLSYSDLVNLVKKFEGLC